jgi:hypothetical protein
MVYDTSTTFPGGQTQLAILLFPWAECGVFVDALLIIGMLGCQPDNNTLETTIIFQSIMYSAVVFVSYSYDLYEKNHYDNDNKKWDDKNIKEVKLPNDETYLMSFCSNTASFFLTLIPTVLILKRITYSTLLGVPLIILLYLVFLVLLYFIRWIWHMTRLSVLPLGSAELFWNLKSFLQIVCVLSLVILADSRFDTNNVMRANLKVWHVNYS